ncbi:MAG: glycosyltransferase family 4 protein [Planctomycetes bacterium]|nr:glycosyltransferase family 4 protein [Planctomycetota bacterium]MCH9725493.1 glycosyltransferase family 4 protein [Planctomycetota bacterium]MCH9779024.1 glycosyltransferase family 4 protein [Planctomycetota bacterium]MCH9790518.1 glycosyltransferase family 4 protein [Planctomycetota bacterium]
MSKADSPIDVLLFAGPFEVRGTSAYTLRLAQHAINYGINTCVVCPDAAKVDPRIRSNLEMREYRNLNVPLLGQIVLRLVKQELLKQPPDLIHIQSRHVLPQGQWLARKIKRPFILTVNDYLQSDEKLRIDLRWCRGIITVSESVKKDLLARTSLPEELILVIPSGVHVPDHSQLLPVLSQDHQPVVGTAGPLEAIKGLPYFLGAASRVLAVNPNVQFLISGAGPEESNLRYLARDLEISENVTFVSNLYDFSISLEAMDIFCLSSLRQGLGTIMLEAMSLAKPVIATGVGGIYSVIRDGETGLVVPPSNSEALTNSILTLLEDPLKARAMGESARELVRQEFRVETMVERTVEQYKLALHVAS